MLYDVIKGALTTQVNFWSAVMCTDGDLSPPLTTHPDISSH
jgi:hypothetical protein